MRDVEEDEDRQVAVNRNKSHNLMINTGILSRLSSLVKSLSVGTSPHLEWSSSSLLTCATIMSNATVLNPPCGMITSA